VERVNLGRDARQRHGVQNELSRRWFLFSTVAAMTCAALDRGAWSGTIGKTADVRPRIAPIEIEIARVQLAAAMREYQKYAPLDFGLMLGDNFYPNGIRGPDDPQWKTKWKDLNPNFFIEPSFSFQLQRCREGPLRKGRRAYFLSLSASFSSSSRSSEYGAKTRFCLRLG
jgi:hypothetical protein